MRLHSTRRQGHFWLTLFRRSWRSCFVECGHSWYATSKSLLCNSGCDKIPTHVFSNQMFLRWFRPSYYTNSLTDTTVVINVPSYKFWGGRHTGAKYPTYNHYQQHKNRRGGYTTHRHVKQQEQWKPPVNAGFVFPPNAICSVGERSVLFLWNS